MCGITGFLGFENNTNKDDLMKTLSNMTNALFHRGPDDFGVWYNFDDKIFLGHRRLSVIDLKKTSRWLLGSKNVFQIKLLKRFVDFASVAV